MTNEASLTSYLSRFDELKTVKPKKKIAKPKRITPIKKPVVEKEKAKKNKRNAKIVIIDGEKFHSIAESEYYLKLKADKDVYGLKPHPTFKLQESFKADGRTYRGFDYNSDFQFKRHSQPGKVFVVEIKGQLTPDANIKIKLFRKLYPDLVFSMLTTKFEDWYEAKKAASERKRAKKKAAKEALAA